MAKSLTHRGVIVGIESTRLKVRIVQMSACSACSVKSTCGVSESKEKLIDVLNPKQIPCQIGDEVTLVGKEGMGLKAVLWAFVIPFLLIVLALCLALHFFPGKEVEAALFSIAILVPYYLVLYALRKRLDRIFTFELDN